MASYALKASYSTVQVLSSTLTQDVQYCTIQTSPSAVIASITVSAEAFADNMAASALTNFADAIETIMVNPAVIAATGSQTIDQSGLLADSVIFTLKYPAGETTPDTVTADATVPVGLLDFSDAEIGRTLEDEVNAILNKVYGNLRSAAGG